MSSICRYISTKEYGTAGVAVDWLVVIGNKVSSLATPDPLAHHNGLASDTEVVMKVHLT
jgi:hypothetical protein